MMTRYLPPSRSFVLAAFIVGSTCGVSEARAQTPQRYNDALRFEVKLQGQININTATAAQLDLLPGIGPATSAKIVAYRERHPFRHISHLMRVDGVGPKTFAAIQQYLTLDGETTLGSVPSGPSHLR